MSIRSLLNDEIQAEFKELNNMEVGSETYCKAIDGVTKLVDRAIEMEKIDEASINRKMENDLKASELKDERKDRLVKNCLTGVSIVTGVGLTVWGTLKSLKFEEEGTVTTIVGRGFINKLLPKK